MTQISVRELGSTDPIRTHGFTIIAIDPSIEPEVVEPDPASQDRAGAADGGVDALASVRAGLPPELQPMGVLEGLMAAVFLVGLLGVTLIRRGRAKPTDGGAEIDHRGGRSLARSRIQRICRS